MDKYCVGFSDVYDKKEDIIFTAKNLNILCSLNKSNGIVKKLCNLTKDEILRYDSFDSIIEHEGKLIVLSNYGNSICSYNCNTKERIIYEYIVEKKNYVKAIDTDDVIWIVPVDINENIFIFNKNICEFSEKVNISNSVRMLAGVGEEVRIGFYPYLDNDMIYLSLLNTNKIITIHIVSDNVEKIELPSQYKIRNIMFVDGTLWGTLYNSNSIISYDCRTKEIIEYQPSNDIGDVGMVISLFVLNEKKMVYSSNGIYLINEKECIYKGIESIIDEGKDLYYTFSGEYMYIYGQKDNKIYTYNKDMEYVSTLEVNEKSLDVLCRRLIEEEYNGTYVSIIKEFENGFKIETVLDELRTVDENKKYNLDIVGQKVWKEIKV